MSTQPILIQPSLVMEASWEVCNKVGGIYTVLSSRAASMVKSYGTESVLFVGPYLQESIQGDFVRHSSSMDKELTRLVGLPVYMGNWAVPGAPQVALVDYTPLYDRKNVLYYEMWEEYGVRSELGYGDYDESCLFAVAAAKVMVAYATVKRKKQGVVSIFNEWTTGMGLLWLRLNAPEIATIFITHATSVGRSIAGNGKDLYAYMAGYNGDQMSRELGVEAKHALEKLAAHTADVFGTVSEVTAKECAQILERRPDVILENGFEKQLVPDRNEMETKRQVARSCILSVARTLYGAELYDDTLIVMTSGRFEYRNKGLDIFVESVKRLAEAPCAHSCDIVALIAVPSWVKTPRNGLIYGLESKEHFTLPMSEPYLTHWLNEPDNNPLQCRLRDLSGLWGNNVYPIYLPAYLDGKDGIIDLSYYDTLPGVDMTVFASYYEPWGYTPLESIAYGIPTITTDKAGFGAWAREKASTEDLSSDGVLVLERNDSNIAEVTERISQTVCQYAYMTGKQRGKISDRAYQLSCLADWDHFFRKYEIAFDAALKKCMEEVRSLPH